MVELRITILIAFTLVVEWKIEMMIIGIAFSILRLIVPVARLYTIIRLRYWYIPYCPIWWAKFRDYITGKKIELSVNQQNNGEEKSQDDDVKEDTLPSPEAQGTDDSYAL